MVTVFTLNFGLTAFLRLELAVKYGQDRQRAAPLNSPKSQGFLSYASTLRGILFFFFFFLINNEFRTKIYTYSILHNFNESHRCAHILQARSLPGWKAFLSGLLFFHHASLLLFVGVLPAPCSNELTSERN